MKQILESMSAIRNYMALIEVELQRIQRIQGEINSEKQEVIDAQPGLDKHTIARIFAGVRQWNEEDWLSRLNNSSKALWVQDAIVKQGRKGVGGGTTFNPAILVRNAVYNNFNNYVIKQVSALFAENKLLAPWNEEWKKLCPARMEYIPLRLKGDVVKNRRVIAVFYPMIIGVSSLISPRSRAAIQAASVLNPTVFFS